MHMGHTSEEFVLGAEEKTIMSPAIRAALARRGIQAPLPASRKGAIASALRARGVTVMGASPTETFKFGKGPNGGVVVHFVVPAAYVAKLAAQIKAAREGDVVLGTLIGGPAGTNVKVRGLRLFSDPIGNVTVETTITKEELQNLKKVMAAVKATGGSDVVLGCWKRGKRKHAPAAAPASSSGHAYSKLACMGY